MIIFCQLIELSLKMALSTALLSLTPKTNSNIILNEDELNKSNVNKQEIDNTTSINNLMDKLRSRATQMKSWTEIGKMLKTSLSEKRHLVDVNERSQLQKCLDTIQKNIRVTSLQSMVERLETICRQLGLKFSGTSTTKGIECFVHSEMYYVEVLLEPQTGYVIDCKIAHQTEATVIEIILFIL